MDPKPTTKPIRDPGLPDEEGDWDREDWERAEPVLIPIPAFPARVPDE
jgi:hypothetical protein